MFFRCKEAVNRFLANSDPDGYIEIGADMRKIHQCFRIMKTKVLENAQDGSSNSLASTRLEPSPSPPRTAETGDINSAEYKKLQDILRQRDNEISILLLLLG